jgi:2-oxoglutarate dehydrogenase complex dehydrogenase (E1) component-like enzyme
MSLGTTFQPIIDINAHSNQTKRLIMCSGKHYYTLMQALEGRQDALELSIIRIEELSPFPSSRLSEILGGYKNVERIVWAQEEPENQGPWSYVESRIRRMLRGLGRNMAVEYAGRRSMPTVAVSVGSWHKLESEEIVKAALGDQLVS